MGTMALLLCCACELAAREAGHKADGGGDEQIPQSVRQWTKDVMLLQKEYGTFAFLNANLNRTFAMSRQLPVGDTDRIAGSAQAVHAGVTSLAVSWEDVDQARLPSQYARAVTAWEQKIGRVRSEMESAACSYCDLPAPSTSGEVPVINTCTAKVGDDCAVGGCLECCEDIPDTGLQHLCRAQCQHRSALCLLSDAIERHSGTTDKKTSP
jgi:hypothetical protein